MLPPAGTVTPKQNAAPRNATLTRTAKKPVTTANTAQSRKLADNLTNRVTAIKGVRSATVVVQPANNRYTVLVGLTLNSDVKGTRTTAIKKEVTDKLKKADKRITRVMVTTNPDLVKRLEDIARGVLAGKPIQSFATEISELTRRIGPTVK
jgi:YhcN/YlaJ family sporulation lipoprotein